MRSIRKQLVLNLVLAMLALFILLAFVFFAQTQSAFRHQFDAALGERVETFADLIEVVRGRGIVFGFHQLHLPEFEASETAAYFDVRNIDGHVIARSGSLETESLPDLEPGMGAPRFHDIQLPDGRPGRAAVLRFVARPADGRPPPDYDPDNPDYDLVMVMARSREPLDRARSVVLNGFLLFGLLLVCGTVLGAHRAVRHGLEPLDRMASELSDIQADKLDWRFDSDSVPDELVPVASRLNELLGRLEQAFRRERRLTGDIAHELRTPIAELRALAELGLRHDDGDEGPDYLSDTLEIASRMESCVGSLLALARCESGLLTPILEDLDLVQLVHESYRAYRGELESKGIEIELDLPQSATVRTDRGLLLSILSNLFSNAAAYTDAGGRVVCRAVPGPKDRLNVTVANTASSLEPEDLENLYSPFWQKDPSRSDQNHVGLGLALARSYSELLRLSLRVEVTDSGWFEASIRLRLSSDPSDIPRRRPLLQTSR